MEAEALEEPEVALVRRRPWLAERLWLGQRVLREQVQAYLFQPLRWSGIVASRFL